MKVDLLLAHLGELECQVFSLCKTIHEDEIHHANVRVEDSLEQDATFDALDRYLPRDLLDGDVVGNLDQQV